MGVNGESLQLHAVYKKSYFLLQARENPYQYYKSRKIPYQVLQVTRAASERAMVCMINHYHHTTKLYRKNHSFVAVDIVTRAAHS